MLLSSICKTALWLLPLASATPTVVTKFVTSSDGTKIYAEGTGNPANPALVLIPGFMFGSVVFDKQFEDTKVTKDVFLVRYDPRGQGQSDKPETEAGYTSRLFSDDFVAVSEAFGLRKPVVAGWSLGGTTLVDIAAHAGPEYVSGGILMASPIPFNPDLEGSLPPVVVELFPGILSTNDVALHKRSVLSFGNLMFANPAAISLTDRMAWIGSTLLQTPIASQLTPNHKQDSEPFLQAGKDGQLKLLILEGEKDATRPNSTATAATLKPYFDDLELVIFKGAGHGFFCEQPKKVNRVLRDFVQKVASRS